MTALANLAMRFIKPYIKQAIQTIDQHENLMESAKAGEDIVPIMAGRYLPQAFAALSPYASYIAPYVYRPDFQDILYQIIRQTIEELAVADGENKEEDRQDGIAAVARDYPEWLFDQARRMANLLLMRLMQ
jgi:protoheme ferro-lyase